MRERTVVGLGAAATTIASVLMATLPRAGVLAHTAADDAFYYLAIARSAGGAHWPTFDGAHTTTGFHPLWLLMLVGLTRLAGSPWVLLRLSIALSSALIVAASLDFGRLFGRVWGTSAGVIGAVLLVASPGTARLGWMTMETPLALLCMSRFLTEIVRRPTRALPLGIWTGLTILARLDMALLITIAFVWSVVVKRRIPLLAAARAGVLALLLVAPYVGWNIALTGHVATISSATKSYVASEYARKHFGGRLTAPFVAHVARDAARAGKDLVRLTPAAMFAGPIALAGGDHPSGVDTKLHGRAMATWIVLMLVLGWRIAPPLEAGLPDSAGGSSDLLIVLAIASAMHAAAACIFLTGQSGPWYWGLEVVTAVAVVSYTAARWRVARSLASLACGATVVSAVMLVIALLAGRTTGRFEHRDSFAGDILDVGEAAGERRLPNEAVGSCNAGALGFFQPGVVNLDGLVNDWSFLNARRHGDVRGYLARENVRWVVDCVPANAMDRYAGQLGLSAGDIESKIEKVHPACVAFAWHLSDLR